MKINLFDRCTARGSVEHFLPYRGDPESCAGTKRKRPRRVQIVEDGSGEFDVYTEHMIDHAGNVGNGKPKIGWIRECETINPVYFNKMRNNKDYYFNVLGFDAIYTYDYDIISRDSRFKYSLGEGFFVHYPKIWKKSKLVSMIVSNRTACPGHIYRLKFRDKYKDCVDLFGVGHNFIPDKEDGLRSYMFSFAMENDVVDGMMSEKLFDCFATGTIPIYLGTKVASKYFNSDGIIYLDEFFDIKSLTPDLYYSKIDAVRENFDLVMGREIPIDYIFKEYF